MVDQTGCAGVVVGRGCLGRPWLFGQLAAAFAGQPIPGDPGLPVVMATFRRHAELLIAAFGEYTGSREIRKHVAWYFKGYSVKRQVRLGLANVGSLGELDDWLAQIDPDQPPDEAVMSSPRGRTGGERPPALPDGWLDSPYLAASDARIVSEAELSVSGG